MTANSVKNSKPNISITENKQKINTINIMDQEHENKKTNTSRWRDGTKHGAG